MNSRERVQSIAHGRPINASLPEMARPMPSTNEITPRESTLRESTLVLRAPPKPAPGTTTLERFRQRKICRWMLGYLAEQDSIDHETMRRAIVYGSALASYCVEGVGVNRLIKVGKNELLERYRAFSRLAHFDTR